MEDFVKAQCQELKLSYIRIKPLIKTETYDDLVRTVRVVHDLCVKHPDYDTLAARILQFWLRSHTTTFSSYITKHPGVSSEFKKLCEPFLDDLDVIIDYENDKFLNNTPGMMLFLHMYQHYNAEYDIYETPQIMFLRIASFLCLPNIALTRQIYRYLSEGYYTHATPTMLNAGFNKGQLASCFLMTMNDSIEDIGNVFNKIALISSKCGGLALDVSRVRGKDSLIGKYGNISKGIYPFLNIIECIVKNIDQGGKRNGAATVYLEPWHYDIEMFIELKRPVGHGKLHDLNFGLWVPDLFMERVLTDSKWTLFSPDIYPGLADVYGDEFKTLYEYYENNKDKYNSSSYKEVEAATLWRKIVQCIIECGNPHVLFKDASNAFSNHNNKGMIRSSNLCTEIIQFADEEHTAVCNLAALCLPKFVTPEKSFDFERLADVVTNVVVVLNNSIDRNVLPHETCDKANANFRPLGIGVQGMFDMFQKMGIDSESEQAYELNKLIFEHIYYNAVSASADIAAKDGSYPYFTDSMMAHGIFHMDHYEAATPTLDWDGLKVKTKTTGIRNSLVTALMPTSSCSMLFGHSEGFEPHTNNVYLRKLKCGEFTKINKILVEFLKAKNILTYCNWMKLMNEGKGNVNALSDLLSEAEISLFKTAWEIKQKSIVKMSIDRAPYIDQSQSLSMFYNNPQPALLHSALIAGWRGKLKTGIYYLRTKRGASPVDFVRNQETENECDVCAL